MFQAVPREYHSVRQEAARIVKLAARYGATIDDVRPSSTGASVYIKLSIDRGDDDRDQAECRVSRHEPNYALRSDRDIMVYADGDWLGVAENFCRQFERHFQVDRPPAVLAYLQTLAIRKTNKDKAAAEAAAEHERQRQVAQAEASQQYRRRLLARCAEHKITREKIEAAYAGRGTWNPCGLSSQLLKWFSGMPLEQALGFAIDARPGGSN